MALDPPRSAPQWELIPLGRGGWRICDRSLAPTDPDRVFAHVEKSEDGILDVLWTRSPCPTRSRYRDFDELFADLDAALAAGRQSRSGPPRAIPHFPPTGAFPVVPPA
jgi:hypothetical protein